MFAAVITTIQEPTRAVVKLVQKLADCGGLLVVAGDKKDQRISGTGISLKAAALISCH